MNVPFFKQQTDWFCGPAVIQSVLAAFGIEATQKELATELGTASWKGTDRADMGRPLRRRGLEARSHTLSSVADMGQFLSRGWVVMVNYIEPSEEICHFAVVIRVTAKRIYFVDPWNGPNFSLPVAEFVSRWYGCAKKSRERWFLAAKPKHRD